MQSFPQYDNTAMEEQGASTEGYTRGVAYVRWGRTVCPSGAEVVYKGRAINRKPLFPTWWWCVTLKRKNYDWVVATCEMEQTVFFALVI